MTKVVDSYRFIGGITKRMVKSWIQLESPRDIPWTPLLKPLSDCTVAMISTSGSLKRIVPSIRRRKICGVIRLSSHSQTTRTEDIRVYHHIDPVLNKT
jgi:hypothetical protein